MDFTENQILNLLDRKEGKPFSIGLLSSLDRDFIIKSDPDIIHLHWICGAFISISDMRFLAKYKIVWTLHDSWAFTGGCHIPYDCKKYMSGCSECKYIGKNKVFDIAKYIFKLKEKYYLKQDITIVTPSRWLSQCAKLSRLFQDKLVYTIGNTIDTSIFKVKDKAFARDMLNIKCDEKVILFGAVSATSDENKGFKYLHGAIRLLYETMPNEKIKIIIFGSNGGKDEPDFGFDVEYMGFLHDDISLSLLYSAVDVMVNPSKSESFSNVIMEAMACGTPCVAFNVGGIPDIIEHEVNGYLAKPFEVDDLARGIRYILSDEDRRKELSSKARKKIVENFSMKMIANKYISLYEDILDGTKFKN